MNPSMAGKWDYSKYDRPWRYGDDNLTYVKGMEWLAGCATIEDWGCGMAWAKQFTPKGSTYVSVDGSASKFTDKVEDLVLYKTKVEGIFMRHVLEHNLDWEEILKNFMSSFTKKASLVFFTPWRDKTEAVLADGVRMIYDVLFKKEDITQHFINCKVTEEFLPVSKTAYGSETIFYLER